MTRPSLALIVALAILGTTPAGQATAAAAGSVVPALADTPASRQARRLLDSLTASDEAHFLAFIREAYPTAKRSPTEWQELRLNLHRLQFHAVMAASPTQADLSTFNPDRGDWLRISVTVEPAAPYAITDFAFRLTPRPADAPAPPKLQPPALAAAARARIEAEVADSGFAGAVLIAQKGHPIFQAAYGLADNDARTPNTLQTRFRFGSMGKMFTTVAVMQLAQAGKLDLSAPVGRYLPDYPNADIAAKVTVDQLLMHSGGTGDIFGPEFDAHQATLRTPSDYIALYGARPPLFAPGARHDYSNYGFIILGRIVEVVSGLTYNDYVQRNIFGPTHMTATGNRPESEAVPNRAVSYMTVDGGLEPATPASTVRLRGTPQAHGYVEQGGGPAGGGYATVGDFLRFSQALLAHRLLNADYTQRLMTIRKLPDGTVLQYDFNTLAPDGRRFVGHGGGAPGQSGDLRIFPESGAVIVVLANRDPPIAGRIAAFISDRTP